MKHIVRVILLLALAAGSISILVNGSEQPVEIHIELPPPAKTVAAVESAWEMAASQNEVTFYRVRNADNSPESQIGAYTDPETAKECCPENYCVFDQNGVLIFRQTCGKPFHAASSEKQSETN